MRKLPASVFLLLAFCAPAFAEGQSGLSVATKPGTAPSTYTVTAPPPQLLTPRPPAPQSLDFYIRKPATLDRALPSIAAQGCPADSAGWQQWRDDAANRLLSNYIETGGQRLLSHFDVVAQSDELNIFIKGCRERPEFGQANAAGIIANLERFVQMLGINRYSDHRFGFVITDQQYLANIKAQAELPPLLKGQQFLKNVSNPATYKDALRMIEEHNKTLPGEQQWEVLLYKSRFLTTPDQARTNGRFFIYVPDGAIEKWIQFGIVTPGDPIRRINNLSIVAIGAPDAAGNRPTAIVDIWRTYEADGTISLATRYEKVNETENCAMCHKTSPLGLHPSEEYVVATDGRLVLNTVNPGEASKRLNARIEGYGPPFFQDWMQVTAFGPTIGPSGRQRDMTFMRACSSRQMLSDASIANVQRSMRCSSCHSPDGLGPLNYPQALRTNFPSLQLREFITQGWMPPNNRLTATEREALYSCLIQEYHDPTTQTGLLLDWLRGVGP